MDSIPAAADGPARPRSRHLPLLTAVVALAVIGLDQGTKYLAVRDLTPGVPVPVIDGVLQFRLIRNSGAAFSLATGMTWVLTVIAATVSVVIVRIARRLGSARWALALGLLLGGAVGNLLDRLFREPGFARGHVVDFIEYTKFPFMDFPVFNLADSCVVTAACLIALLGFIGLGVDGRREGGAAPAAVPGEGSASAASGAGD